VHEERGQRTNQARPQANPRAKGQVFASELDVLQAKCRDEDAQRDGGPGDDGLDGEQIRLFFDGQTKHHEHQSVNGYVVRGSRHGVFTFFFLAVHVQERRGVGVHRPALATAARVDGALGAANVVPFPGVEPQELTTRAEIELGRRGADDRHDDVHRQPAMRTRDGAARRLVDVFPQVGHFDSGQNLAHDAEVHGETAALRATVLNGIGHEGTGELNVVAGTKWFDHHLILGTGATIAREYPCPKMKLECFSSV